MFTDVAYRCIGHIPSVPIIENMLNNKSQQRKRLNEWLFLTSLSIILEPFKKMSHRGVLLEFPKGRLKMYYPIPVFYSADLMEYQALFGISASKTGDGFQDPQYLIRTDSLDKRFDIFDMPRKRTEANTVGRIRRACEEFGRGEEEKAKETLSKYSLDKIFLYSPKDEPGNLIEYFLQKVNGERELESSIPLAGFNFTDCHTLVTPDKLHTFDSGVGALLYSHNPNEKNSLFNIIVANSSKQMNSITGKMSKGISESSPLTDYALPTTKFVGAEHAKKKVSSEQSANLRRLLLVACPVDVNVFRPLIKPLKGKHLSFRYHQTLLVIYALSCVAEYLDLEQLVLYKIHTEDSLRRMLEKIGSLQKALVESWVEVTGGEVRNLKTMKWFALKKFVTEVKRSSCASITNTGPLERTHKSWKEASGFTNRHPETMDKQTVNRLHTIKQ